jgi:hypothetical protein
MTAREICIEQAKAPEMEGSAVLHNRFVEMADAIRIHKAKDQIRPTAEATRAAAKSISIIVDLIEFIDSNKDTEDAKKAKMVLRLNLIKITETVVHNLELTEAIMMPSTLYSLINPIFYNKEIIRGPRLIDFLKSFECESKLASDIYRSMDDNRSTLMALRGLFTIGWVYDIDLDEELIQLTKEKE